MFCRVLSRTVVPSEWVVQYCGTNGKVISSAKTSSIVASCLTLLWGTWLLFGYAVAQFAESLRYKPEGRGFVSLWGRLDFFIDNPSGRIVVLGSTYALSEMSTKDLPRSKGDRCVRLTTLPHLCADCLKILGASTSRSRRNLSRSVQGLLFE